MPSGATSHALPESAAGAATGAGARKLRIALLGNPNTGKTTLFNRLCGLRAKTANFPGSTVERHVGNLLVDGDPVEIVDLPGVYSLSLSLPESRICADFLRGDLEDCVPDAAILVVDANNLARNLQFAASALHGALPFVVAVNMVDLAERRGVAIDANRLGEALGCPVVGISARTGVGVPELLSLARQAARQDRRRGDREVVSRLPAEGSDSATVAAWAAQVAAASLGGRPTGDRSTPTFHDRMDMAFTHPVIGVAVFALVMGLLFAAIFWVASWPMDAVDLAVGHGAATLRATLPSGALTDLLIDGVLQGVGIALVFLPQICLLFFLITLLEDSGYLARAAFAVDRIMSRFGLPGQAFVPLLSSHACALPGILSARLIPDRRDRLATILVAPFMSCSARLQVYTLVISLLFLHRPLAAAAVFVACYALGALAGMGSAFLVRRTLLRGRSRPLVLELPDYRLPSLRTALWTTWDRGLLFVRNVATVILFISIVMWWLSAYPRAPETAEVASWRVEALRAEADGQAGRVEALRAEADRVQSRLQQAQSFAGRLGSALEPIFRPLGFDRQLTIGVLTSFLAREVFATTMSVLAEAPSDDPAERDLIRSVQAMRRDDGSPLFTPATCASVLVFFVLAMQCLPTMALVRRETGGWRWMGLQFVWMSGTAWLAAAAVYHLLRSVGVS